MNAVKTMKFCKICGEFSGEFLYDLQFLAVIFLELLAGNRGEKNSPLRIADRKNFTSKFTANLTKIHRFHRIDC